jgi:hypothetical protein
MGNAKALDLDLHDIRTTLGDAGISSAVTCGTEGAGFVHVPATAEEWIAVTPSDDRDELWHVALYGPGAPVISELHRLKAGEWTPRDGIEIVRDHLAARGLRG